MIEHFVATLKECGYGFRNLGEWKYSLGMDVKYDRKEGRLSISHSSYLSTFFASLPWYKPTRKVTPARANSQLRRRAEGDTSTFWWSEHFRKCLGAMAHVSHWTFPEIALTISMCSQHMSNPGEEHWPGLLGMDPRLRAHEQGLRAALHPLQRWSPHLLRLLRRRLRWRS